MNLEPLIYWARERESIRKKKEAGEPPPWTDDPILQRYRFCNVRRRDDRVSRWLCDHVLTEFCLKQAGLASFLMFSAFCRWVNWPPTIKAIMDAQLWTSNPDWTAIGSKVDELQRSGRKAWTGAYMVRAKPGDNRGKGRFVAEDVIEKSLTPVTHTLIEAMKMPVGGVLSRQLAWTYLEGCLNWGSFMAGQVVADWGYTSLLKDAPDTYTWAPIGPGSKRGFNRIMERSIKHRVTPEEWNELLPQWRGKILEVTDLGSAELTLHDVQNSLCETDKYLRVKNGEGRPRATYKPETAY